MPGSFRDRVLACCPHQSGLGLFVYNGAGNVNLLQSATAGAAVATAQLGYGLLIFNGGACVDVVSLLL